MHVEKRTKETWYICILDRDQNYQRYWWIQMDLTHALKEKDTLVYRAKPNFILYKRNP